MSDTTNRYRPGPNQDIAQVIKQAERIRARGERIGESDHDNMAQAPSEGSLASSIRELNENISWLRRAIITTKQIVTGLGSTVLAPAWRLVKPPFSWLWRKYTAVWHRFAYVRTGVNGELVLSRTRSSFLVLLTVALLSVFTNTRLGEAVRFVTIEPVIDGAMMAASLRTEIFYLTQSQEIDPEGNVHSVRGCRTRGECSEVDAAYFRVSPRLSHDIWKLCVHGNPIYVPDHAVSPIAPGLNECRVTYYGYRMTSSWIARVLRSLQVYPTMLEASCVYLGSNTSSTIHLSDP
jgi:hypothetical protein